MAEQPAEVPLHRASNAQRNDRAFVWTAVRNDPTALAFAADHLRADKEIVVAAVALNVLAIHHAAPSLWDDPEVQDAVAQRWPLGLDIPSRVRGHRGMVLALVRARGRVLHSLPAELQNDRQVVLLAVGEDGSALQYASETLRADPEVVRLAVMDTGWALQFAADEWKGNKEIVLAALEARRHSLHAGEAFGFSSFEIRSDKEVAMIAVQKFGGNLIAVSAALKGDEEVVCAALRADLRNRRSVLNQASNELKAKREVVILAMEGVENASALFEASEQLQLDPTVVERVVIDAEFVELFENAGSALRQTYMTKAVGLDNSLRQSSLPGVDLEDPSVNTQNADERLVDLWENLWLCSQVGSQRGMEQGLARYITSFAGVKEAINRDGTLRRLGLVLAHIEEQMTAAACGDEWMNFADEFESKSQGTQ